jgi:hypothetical protein
MPAPTTGDTAGNTAGNTAGDGTSVRIGAAAVDATASAAGARRAAARSTVTRFTIVTSPIGDLLLTDDGAGLSGLFLPAPDGTAAGSASSDEPGGLSRSRPCARPHG